MDQEPTVKKTSPACGSADYLFHSRKKMKANAENSEPAAVETKYRCKTCGNEWRVRVPVKEAG
jgi:DNA-directed RNA polymerase subunit M/transcription elongation factor TFIIS